MEQDSTRIIICGLCGKPFEFVRKRGKPATYCSPQCHREVRRRRSLENYYADTKKYNEKSLQWSRDNREHANEVRNKRLKERQAARPLRRFVCSICGIDFERPNAPGHPPNVCSSECKAERSRRQAKQWFKDNPERVSSHPSRNPEHRSRVFREWYEANREREIQRAVDYAKGAGREAKLARDARRRALRLGSPESEDFTLDEIFERDGGVCHLCSKSVSRRDATMDHVVPLTRGGPHTRVNVKLAHRGCNSRKGDRLVT